MFTLASHAYWSIDPLLLVMFTTALVAWLCAASAPAAVFGASLGCALIGLCSNLLAADFALDTGLYIQAAAGAALLAGGMSTVPVVGRESKEP